MSKSKRLRAEDWRGIVRLIGDCRDLGDDPIAWRRRWAEGLARATDADLGVAGEMADCLATPRDLGKVDWSPQGAAVDPSRFEHHLPEFRRDPAYYSILLSYFGHLAAEEGACRTRSDLVPDRPWYASFDFQVVHRTFGVDHILYCFRRISGPRPGEWSGSMLMRAAGRRDFSPRDRAYVHEACAALAGYVGGPLARFGEPSPSDLPPRARQVLACLLEGDGDKQVAARLGLSRFTVNQHAKGIFRHFSVKSRGELLALWVRRAYPVPPDRGQ